MSVSIPPGPPPNQTEPRKEWCDWFQSVYLTLVGTLSNSISSALKAVTDSLNSHLSDFSNPHKTTKAQILTGNLIVDSDVDLAAQIERPKLANGTPLSVVVNDSLGVMKDVLLLPLSNGGTATDLSSLVAEDLIVGNSSSKFKRISKGSESSILTITGGVIAWATAFIGNALTATTLQTPRTINGVSFDGSANIVVTAAAGTLTGATLASNVLASSLTSVGTLGALTVTATIAGNISGNAATVTTNANLTGNVTSVGNATTIASGVVTNAMLAGSIAYSKLVLTGAVLNADLAGSIAYSKLSLTGAILNADLAGSIADSKLSTISTALKVSNSATTATNANTASAIVARDASGNFSAGLATLVGITNTGDVNLNAGSRFATAGYQTSTPSTGNTVACNAFITGILFTPAGTLATLTIQLPNTSLDGMEVWVASTQTITAATWQDHGGTAGNVIGGPSTFGGTNKGCRFVYNLANTKWMNIG
jgi:hypothetical protein